MLVWISELNPFSNETYSGTEHNTGMQYNTTEPMFSFETWNGKA